MKKLIAFAAVAVLCAGAAFARTSRASRTGSRSSGASGTDGTSIHAVGFDVPIWNQSWLDLEYSDITMYRKFSATGFNLMCNHLVIAPNHFSTFVDAELGYVGFKFKNFTIDGTVNDTNLTDVMNGFNTRFVYGIGGAPLNNDRVSLAIHGTVGLNLATASHSESNPETDEYYASTDSWSVFGFWMTFGANVESAVRITGNFGAFAGIDMYINLYGLGIWSRAYSIDNPDQTSYSGSNFCMIFPGQFNIDFRFGVAFIF